jgi:hypothetical protein
MRPTRSRIFLLVWITSSLFAFVGLGTPLLLTIPYKTWANPVGIALVVVVSLVAGFGLACCLRVRSAYQPGFPVVAKDPGDREAE